jgi:hypothetical protein
VEETMVQQRARDLAASWPLRSLPPAVSARASPLVFINAADGRDILSTGGIYNTSTYDDCCYLLLHDVVPNGGHLFAHGATAYNGGSHLFLNDGVRQRQRSSSPALKWTCYLSAGKLDTHGYPRV